MLMNAALKSILYGNTGGPRAALKRRIQSGGVNFTVLMLRRGKHKTGTGRVR
jgi:hypothetical protein